MIKKFKITPFLVLLVPALFVSVALTVYYLFINVRSPEATVGGLALIISFILFGILVFDRLTVKYAKIGLDKICKAQALIIGIMLLAYILAVLTS